MRIPLYLFLITSGWMQSASAFSIALNYSNDSSNFFGNATAKAALEQAAADLSAAITSTLNPITTDVYTGTSGSTTATFNWSLTYTNPTTDSTVTLNTFTAAANTFTIYVGARPIAGTTLGQGGIGGIDLGISGSGQSSQWIAAVAAAEASSNTSMRRGTNMTFSSLAGDATLGMATANYLLKTGPILGNLWFDNDSDNDTNIDNAMMLDGYWNFDHTLASFGTKNDFYSVALHEMIHSLGFGESESWTDNHSNTTWLGTNAVVLNGGSGSGLLDSDQAHIVSSYSSTRIDNGMAQETVMDPALLQGSRKYLTSMDLAMLQDMGYQVVPEASTNSMILLGLGGMAWLIHSRKRA